MPTTDWVQPDTIRTREQYKLSTGVNSNRSHSHGAFGDAHDGIITDGEWKSEVLEAAKNTTMSPESGIGDAGQRVTFINDRRWLTTPASDFFSDEIYNALMHISGSVAHVHDFDPLASVDGEPSAETVIRAAALADFDASAPPGVTFRYLEWETNPFQPENQPWGSVSGRLIETTGAVLLNEEFDREGDPLDTEPISVEDFSIAVVPNTYYNPPDVWTYDWNDSFDMWDSGIKTAAYGFTWFEVGALMSVAAVGAEGTIRTGGVDSVFESNAWDIRSQSGSYRTKALPLVIGPTFALTAETAPGSGGEGHLRREATSTLFFESDWTPPPYRIVYTTAATAAAPALRHYPRDGDGRGWGGVTRGYPPPRGRRGYGGARQP